MGIFDECVGCRKNPQYFSTDGKKLCDFHWMERRRKDIIIKNFNCLPKK